MLEDEDALKNFVKTTGARAAIGYWLDIDWLDAAGFRGVSSRASAQRQP